MKIRYVKGDLMKAPENLIIHGCNAQGVMGSGVAKAIRETFPEAYKVYRCLWEGRDGKPIPSILKDEQGNPLPPRGSLLATIISTDPGPSGKRILNAITQENYGRDGKRYVSYDAVARVMAMVEKFYGMSNPVNPHEAIAMPQIGAGLGGGDWSVIASIIESELKTIEPVVYIL